MSRAATHHASLRLHDLGFGALLVVLALGCSPDADTEARDALLMPDWDAARQERLDYSGEQFRTPAGFRVEQVASDELLGSVVNLTFDRAGRPLVALEGEGLRALEDRDGDGIYEEAVLVSDVIGTAHGIYVVGDDDLLVHADGPEAGAGLYRVRSWGDSEATDHVELIATSDGNIQEHGPHTITVDPNGEMFLLYGNHAAPEVEPVEGSPLRALEEDSLVPSYVDPRGHANSIRPPGGTIWRIDLEASEWELYAGGLRNPFDMAHSPDGALMVYEADMEWDRGLPWFRPTRVLHAIAGGDYGWRTGSAKIAFDAIDTLPSVVDVGRGSPVGVVFYEHTTYPEEYRGALFLGDWSRGRIRVLFPEASGATWTGDAQDFVLGEPLNVTDLDVGPDGNLYFSAGGRKTSGGLYRVTYEAAESEDSKPADGLVAALDEPMPRSAWGRARIEEHLAAEPAWADELATVALDAERETATRLRAITLIETMGEGLGDQDTVKLSGDDSSAVRARVASLLGKRRHESPDAVELEEALLALLEDEEALVRRRALESLRRGFGLSSATATVEKVVLRLGDEDRFVRYAAREVLSMVEPAVWEPLVTSTVDAPDFGTFEGLLALAHVGRPVAQLGAVDLRGARELDESPEGSQTARRALAALSQVVAAQLEDELLDDYLRTLEVALTRSRTDLPAQTSQDLLALYPTGRTSADHPLERLLATQAPEGAIEALLDRLDDDLSQEHQIHLAYALRSVTDGWTPELRSRFVAWFDRGFRMRGAASMSGYIEAIWEDTLTLLDDQERTDALAWKSELDAERLAIAESLLEPDPDEERSKGEVMLSQMSLDELAEYLEYDVMAYERYDAEKGERIFRRARCADCHVFGDIGTGGGPDLSTVVKRFRRKEILESILEPSKVISDQYAALDVEMADGRFISGFVVSEDDADLLLIDATGQRTALAKADIVERSPAQVSLMPEGLLDALSLRDLANLFVFLDNDVQEGP